MTCTPPDRQSPGQLSLFHRMHPCPVCEVDRLAMGHYLEQRSLEPPYSTEDLVRHVGSCPPDEQLALWLDPFEDVR